MKRYETKKKKQCFLGGGGAVENPDYRGRAREGALSLQLAGKDAGSPRPIWGLAKEGQGC